MDSLFIECFPRLARVLYRITGDTASAEEAASEAFWKLHSKPPSNQQNTEGWLYRTGVRLALDHVRKAKRRARYETLGAIFRSPSTPHQLLETQETRRRVRDVLNHLRRNHVALIVMRGEELSYAEIASALRINPKSVGTTLARAEEAFRKEYVKRYGHP